MIVICWSHYFVFGDECLYSIYSYCNTNHDVNPRKLTSHNNSLINTTNHYVWCFIQECTAACSCGSQLQVGPRRFIGGWRERFWNDLLDVVLFYHCGPLLAAGLFFARSMTRTRVIWSHWIRQPLRTKWEWQSIYVCNWWSRIRRETILLRAKVQPQGVVYPTGPHNR